MSTATNKPQPSFINKETPELVSYIKPKGSRLARRARSFKDDFLGILSQMRSPGGSVRSASPSSPKLTAPESSNVEDLESNMRQAKLALKHFRDVVAKNKLEMLPGNGTIVLETVAAIYILLNKVSLKEQSSVILSATNQLYQALAQLIRICDEYLLLGDKILGKQNVSQVVQGLEDAIQNLVSLSKDKLITARESRIKKLSLEATNQYSSQKPRSLSEKAASETALRNSLPDIPLTPRERELLKQTSAFVLERHALSSENILTDSPPPKPPHPDRDQCPPPLPPKKRRQVNNHFDIIAVKNSLENLSMRSKSPDMSSVFSASIGSLDSNLRDEDMRLTLGDSTEFFNGNIYSFSHWENSSHINNGDVRTQESHLLGVKTERLSGSQTESGLGSMPSRRSSSQSYSACSQQVSSTRSSQVSHSSHDALAIPDKKCDAITRHCSSSCSSSTDQTFSIQGSADEKTFVSKQSVSHSSTLKCELVTACEKHKHFQSDIVNHLDEGWTLLTSSSLDDDLPPELPKKTRARISQYDNFDDFSKPPRQEIESGQFCQETKTLESVYLKRKDGCIEESKTHHLVHSLTVEGTTSSSFSEFNNNDSQPPPLPMKKKHIMAYMEMFGNASHGSSTEFMRHSLHVYQQSTESSHLSAQSINTCKSHRSLDPSCANRIFPPKLPPKQIKLPTPKVETCLEVQPVVESPSPYTTSEIVTSGSSEEQQVSSIEELVDPLDPLDTLENLPPDICILDQLSVSQFLVLKKTEEEGPELRGGHPDALLVHATKVNKNDFLYQEAFLTTYRTFTTPLELIQKLSYRYEKFSGSQDSAQQRAAHEAFSLLVRIASDLTVADLNVTLLETLIDFIQQLLCRGELRLARAIRGIMLSKCETKRLLECASDAFIAHSMSTKSNMLLDFKSEHIAEQMTLLDAELFQKIEIPEVLIWAQEQNEERSPNLTRFTEHFNKMSYWARSRILEQPDAKERERYVTKFIKIMKHLRKMNNFNSYLALLSALDSAPVRRLEWQKHITEGLKEYCALIDSSSSFRAYRQALSETQPPCIPYIGLVLQDLTFVHIGNNDLLSDGSVNFSKRWQQFNIVENMKRFKKGLYTFKKNERIITFFNDFDESLSEEAMWQISEKIKPRGGKKS